MEIASESTNLKQFGESNSYKLRKIWDSLKTKILFESEIVFFEKQESTSEIHTSSSSSNSEETTNDIEVTNEKNYFLENYVQCETR